MSNDKKIKMRRVPVWLAYHFMQNYDCYKDLEKVENSETIEFWNKDKELVFKVIGFHTYYGQPPTWLNGAPMSDSCDVLMYRRPHRGLL